MLAPIWIRITLSGTLCVAAGAPDAFPDFSSRPLQQLANVSVTPVCRRLGDGAYRTPRQLHRTRWIRQEHRSVLMMREAEGEDETDEPAWDTGGRGNPVTVGYRNHGS
jgi:hypothetical protein